MVVVQEVCCGDDVGQGNHVMWNKKGVSILFGWLGCRPRHLKAYVELHQRLGQNVVVAHVPSSVGMLVPFMGMRDREAARVHETLRSEIHAHSHVVEHPKNKREHAEAPHHHQHPHVAFHVFSNNGFFFLASVLKHAQESGSLKNVAPSVIIDSAPGAITADSGAAALKAHFKFNTKTCASAASAKFVDTQLLPAFRWYLDRVDAVSRERALRSAFDDFFMGSPACHVHILHSPKDQVIPIDDVRSFVAHLLALDSETRQAASKESTRRNRVHSHLDFEGAHVDLMRSDVEKYKRLVAKAIKPQADA